MKITKISVLIPCFNEKDTIISVIEKVQNLDFIDKEIIIVDDGSTDGTKEILKKREVSNKFLNEIFFFHENNQGKGAAIQTAIKNISCEYAVIQDADLEYDPNDYKNLIKPFEEADADVVYGSRFLGGSGYVRLHFFWHTVANKLLTFFCNMMVNLNMTDMETGYKMFKVSEIKKINLQEKSFGIEPEITIKLAKKKLKFFEVAISYNGRSYDNGKKIGFKDAIFAVYCIIKYSILK
jgi:glycosyltransferase involved in cell wall biosynthesis